MILTQIFVVMCTATGPHCYNYVDVVPGILSAPACESAIRQFAQAHAEPHTMLQRARSYYSQMFVATRDDTGT